MKKFRTLILELLASIIFICCIFSVQPVLAAENELTNEQLNAIAMLNYITVLTKEVNASKNSRLFLEKAYSDLINNTSPNAIAQSTLDQLSGLLETMEKYRMLSIKRERIRFLYEKNKADAIKAAIPDSKNLMDFALNVIDIKNIADAIKEISIDSVAEYEKEKNRIESEYLEKGWELDNEEAETLHNSRKDLFAYMVIMVSEFDLPGDLTLTEDSVDEFVEWKNNSNVISRIRFLESNQKTYQAYSGYWLLLAESYYENSEYEKCLEAINSYEDMDIKIFRQDHELANILPLGITAAKEVLSPEEYADYTAVHVRTMIDNSETEDWALRYFAAQALVDVTDVTGDRKYLRDAYDITLDVVNTMVLTQQELNAAYLSEVEEIPVPKNADKKEKDEIKQYNKMLKETRKTEIPPIYEPLRLNCDLLFTLAQMIGISPEEQKTIDRMLHPDGERLFLAGPVDELYWFDHANSIKESGPVEINFGGNIVIIPAAYLTEDTVISVSVSGADQEEPTVFENWDIQKVKRGDEGDLTTYEAALSCDESSHFTWEPDQEVVVDIYPDGTNGEKTEFRYHTVGTKSNWYDYLKVWDGHKNNWYDYAKVWENSVSFDPVTE